MIILYETNIILFGNTEFSGAFGGTSLYKTNLC